MYDFTSGLETEVKDVDNNVKTTMTYDPFGRPTQVTAADGELEATRSTTEYYDADRRVVSRSDFSILGDNKLVSIKHYDQLGRVRLSRSLEDPTDSAADETKGIKVQMRYLFSGANSYTLSSNPYRAAKSNEATDEETMGWSRSKTDKGGRLIEVESFSGVNLPAPWSTSPAAISTGKVVTTYDANSTTVTDQASKQRRSLIDGLGRLIRVDEPTTAGLGDITSPNQKTDYTYDALNNLKQVTQVAGPTTQTRSFNYDSLTRLTNATNPESGLVSYTYDNNSNLSTKTEARIVASGASQGQQVKVTYAYDELNRVTSRGYNDNFTPNVTYRYDKDANNQNIPFAKGRLTNVTNSVSTTDYLQFDRLGRIKQSKQTTQTPEGATPYSFSYDYNISGALTKETYPSNKAIVTEYDAVGRVAGVKKDGGAYYAGAISTDATNRIQYTAHGAFKALKLGNGLWEHTNFNARLQPLQIGLGTSSTASDKLQLNYTYNTAGQTNNNGNVLSQQIVVGTMDVTQSYTYDEVNRLQTATEKLTATPFTQYWKQVFTYDRFGNRQFDSNQTIPSEVLGAALSFNAATNRITTSGYVYDLAGNVTQEPGGRSYTYDAENHQRTYTAATTTNYEYDGDGRRVKKSDTTGTIVYVYDAMGKLAAEYTTTAPQNNGISYLTTDHLGSTRVVTGKDAQGNPTVKARYDFLPFGEETPTTLGGRSGAGYISDNTKQKFTGHERDAESKLDFAQARYCSSATGRFMSVDPLLSSGRPEIPQSWNRYSYVINNPLALVDPDGLDWRRDKDGNIDWYGAKRDTTGTTALRDDELDYPIGNGYRISLRKEGPMTPTLVIFCPPCAGLYEQEAYQGWAKYYAGQETDRPAELNGIMDAPEDIFAMVGLGQAGVSGIRAGFALMSKEETTLLFRGVKPFEAFADDTLNGIVRPKGGHSDPLRHTLGDTNSVFSSWTPDKSIAEFASNPGGGGGAVLQKRFPNSSLIRTDYSTIPQLASEKEFLIRGVVTGAKVTKQ